MILSSIKNFFSNQDTSPTEASPDSQAQNDPEPHHTIHHSTINNGLDANFQVKLDPVFEPISNASDESGERLIARENNEVEDRREKLEQTNSESNGLFSDPDQEDGNHTNLQRPQSLKEIGNTLQQQGKLDEAIQYYQKALEVKLQAENTSQTTPSIDLEENIDERKNELELQDLQTQMLQESTLPQMQEDKGVNPESMLENVSETGDVFVSDETEIFQQLQESPTRFSHSSESLAIMPNRSSQLAPSSLGTSTSLEFGPIKVYLDQAEMYSRERKWDKAIAACQEALQISPNTATAYKLWGNILQKKGETTEAMGYYAKALVIQSDFPEVYANLGSIYAKKEQWNEAISHYQKAIELNPKFAGAYRNLAKIWQQLNETEKQTQCLVYALSLDSSLGKAEEYYQLGNQLFDQGNYDEAARLFRTAVDLKPGFLQACNKLAEALEKQGDWKSAVTYYRQVLDIQAETVPEQPPSEQSPSNASQRNTVSLSHTAQSTANGANNYRQQPISNASATVEPSSPSSGVTNRIQTLLQASRTQPNSDSIRIELGDLYAKLNDWEQAINAYRSALRINPGLASVYLKLSKAFNQIGKSAEMAEAFYRACDIDATLATAKQHLILGQTFEKQKSIEKAVTCYKRAIQIDANCSDAYRRLGVLLSTANSQDTKKKL